MNGYGKKDEREPIRRDPLRLRLKEFLRRGDLTLAAASPAIGRNRTCLQQYVDRGVSAAAGSRLGSRPAATGRRGGPCGSRPRAR